MGGHHMDEIIILEGRLEGEGRGPGCFSRNGWSCRTA